MAFKYLLTVFLSFYLAVSNINCTATTSEKPPPPYRVVSGQVVVDVHGTMFYQTSGQGPTHLVLLDGTLGDVMANNFEVIYDNFDLMKKYTITQIDLVGFGRSRSEDSNGNLSEKYYEGNFFENDADAIIATLEKIGIKNYSVLGWGYGGTVALFVAARAQKGVVNKCIEWAAKPFSSQELVDQERKRLETPVSKWHAETKRRQNLSHKDEYMERIVRRLVDAWQRLLDSDNEMSKINLKKITVPTLLLHTTNDIHGQFGQSEQIQEFAPTAKLLVIESDKHAVHKLPQFKAAVENFLEKNLPVNKVTKVTKENQ